VPIVVYTVTTVDNVVDATKVVRVVAGLTVVVTTVETVTVGVSRKSIDAFHPSAMKTEPDFGA
jgi:hypothetical protein